VQKKRTAASAIGAKRRISGFSFNSNGFISNATVFKTLARFERAEGYRAHVDGYISGRGKLDKDR
jgi:hypothetical protein